MKCIRLFVTAAFVLAVVPAMAQKSIPLVYDQEFTGAKYAEPAYPTVDQAKSLETLPNPFEFSDGKKKVKKFKDWEKRRAMLQVVHNSKECHQEQKVLETLYSKRLLI